MSKIRILSFDVVILGLTVAGGLRANTVTTYSGNPFNINMDLSQNNLPHHIITPYNILNNSNTISNSNTSSYVYSTYGMSTVQKNNLCIFCGTSVPINTVGIPTIQLSGQSGYTVRGQSGGRRLGALQPSPLTILPIATPVTVPVSVVQPSNTSTVTTNIPIIQVSTNFNMPLGAIGTLADPEPSTVLLLVSGVAAIGILHRKRLKKQRI